METLLTESGLPINQLKSCVSHELTRTIFLNLYSCFYRELHIQVLKQAET